MPLGQLIAEHVAVKLDGRRHIGHFQGNMVKPADFIFRTDCGVHRDPTATRELVSFLCSLPAVASQIESHIVGILNSVPGAELRKM